MHFYWLVIGVLCVWRITHLLVAEDGPWDLLARLRRGRLLNCFYCASVWIAVPFAYLIGETWRERGVLWPALSAGAILLERLTAVEPAHYVEDKKEEGNDVLLRQAVESWQGHER